ncbi:MAG: hypothetical protein O6952_06580 [Planctomycetota bacterium]|nr:hypothetical protein [Planctomycetota bacterium]
MTVELKNCEVCEVLMPVDRDLPEPERFVCENCRTLAGPVPGPPTAPVAATAGGDHPELAATQAVTRPPRPQTPVILPSTVAPARRSVVPGLAAAAAVILPLVAGGLILICTVRDRGFAVRGGFGNGLQWFGERMETGASRMAEAVLGPALPDSPRVGPHGDDSGGDSRPR